MSTPSYTDIGLCGTARGTPQMCRSVHYVALNAHQLNENSLIARAMTIAEAEYPWEEISTSNPLHSAPPILPCMYHGHHHSNRSGCCCCPIFNAIAFSFAGCPTFVSCWCGIVGNLWELENTGTLRRDRHGHNTRRKHLSVIFRFQSVFYHGTSI